MKNLKQKMTGQINHLIRQKSIEFKFKKIEKENEEKHHDKGFSGHDCDDNWTY